MIFMSYVRICVSVTLLTLVSGSLFAELPEELRSYEGRLELIYENEFNEIADVDDWIIEGPGRKFFWDGKMTMIPDAQQAVYRNWEEQGRRELDPDKEHYPVIIEALEEFNLPYMDELSVNDRFRGGHIVAWNKAFETEADYIVTYDFKPLSPIGLGIIFFSAKGVNGEDVLSGELEARYGVFRSYTRVDISSYHISYWANNATQGRRGTCNLRKNPDFYALASGNDPSVRGLDYSASEFEFKTLRITLVKDGKNIRFYIDGELSIDFTDTRFTGIFSGDGELLRENVDTGDALKGGRIGLRQMVGLIGQYDNFKVYNIR